MDMRKDRILVVDDEETLCEALKFNLEVEGFEVDVAYCAEEALALPLGEYSLILLDVMMGEISGFKLARMIKDNPATVKVPIIFCTAKDSEDEMVAGLTLGADDYITKPYTLRNVIARVKTVLRRTAPAKREETADHIVIGGLDIDTLSKRVRVDGEVVKLPRKEYEILVMLVRNPGRIYSRNEILGAVWSNEVVVLDRVIDVNITRLRSKLGPYGKHIVTRSGYGYGFEE